MRARRQPDVELLRERAERAERVLLDIEGTLLGFWTDIPQSECERLTLLIRRTLERAETAEQKLRDAMDDHLK